MPRRPRYYLPDIPCHIVQRGNNREYIFHSTEDYKFYLDCLGEAVEKYAVRIHAYVLMKNHVHLLASVSEPESISRMMQSVGRRYVAHFNSCYRRTGTLWEGRYKACLVDPEHYLFVCHRYIELNPVRAELVQSPDAYRWSSYLANAFGHPDLVLTPHEQYLRLGKAPVQRQAAYRALFDQDLPDTALAEIEEACELGLPLGSDQFKREVEKTLGIKINNRGRGRPRKQLADELTAE